MSDFPQDHKADHWPYIELVRVALLLKDVHVGVAHPGPGHGRSAAMTLLPPDPDFDEPWHPTFADAHRVEARWDEEAGWSVAALYEAGSELLPTVWHRGFGVLLEPEDVAGWIDLLLTMPSAASSREDGPYRSHQKPDRAFEARLAAFVR
jgi:hypothetical protein